jgi:hypothetical protein
MALRKTSNLTARDRSFGCAPCARSRKGLHAVTMDDFIVEVQGPDIFVRMRGTSNLAIYHKPNGAPELMARGSPVEPIDFRVQAWTLAKGYGAGAWLVQIATWE